MKARWMGEDDPLCLRHGKVYEVLGVLADGAWYGVVDETGISYVYPAEEFEIVEESSGNETQSDRGKHICPVCGK